MSKEVESRMLDILSEYKKNEQFMQDSKERSFIEGFRNGYEMSLLCDGCAYEPKRAGIDAYHEECGMCSRFYGDMYSS